ncbi:RNA-binding transcriptional accessory protein [Psychromonas sp. psych-6C06]|uniref:Tex family protein n=1 Tax=Psychromonas sp. psych-6C06 TaxID=2058089 RepID=UPI000C333E43|nr:Tex family protein [Psychromonas sp. psych-6C06]PKF62173.1 RNA-binding transcriptional accessory protein [Psychromonas sp. psych-6C06]
MNKPVIITDINQQLTNELNLTKPQVNAFITLYDDGNTVPFIARYRKEMTSGLDDIQLRSLETRLIYLRELDTRREAILKALNESGKLTPQLREQVKSCQSKTILEQLYLPFKSKRVNKAQLAIDAGLESLADKLWFQPESDKTILCKSYRCPAFNNIEALVAGAMQILIERLIVDLSLLDKLRKQLLNNANFKVSVIKGKEQEALKFKDYFNYNEPIRRMLSHRLLAILRAKSEGFLRLKIEPDPRQDKSIKTSYCEVLIANHLGFSLKGLMANNWRVEVIRKAWKSKLLPMLETQIISTLKEKAHEEAIQLFATNLKELLMCAPAGRKVVLGFDPGFRSGCKVAVIDATGKYLNSATIYPHAPQQQYDIAKQQVIKLLTQYQVDLIAIGNGTASRESDQFMSDCISSSGLDIRHLIVSEAGASVYSASALASDELPRLDVSIRGAVSIARRLQDPLAELVKIDAKAIGVGLYQHDVNQTQLSQRLHAVVEDCVNAVGVDLNSASAPLLRYVAGLNPSIAENIVNYRDQHGLFYTRSALKKVVRLGDKAFQQCAGFLRITEAHNPLDNTAVHPESYYLVNKMAKQLGLEIKQLLSNTALLDNLQQRDLIDQQFGTLTIGAIIDELKKPNRDPRPEFKTVKYAEGINEISDLSVGLMLQGVVSNVTNFGAFVDIGVHQDGLVHISHLADKFVSDPTQIVKAGQIVSVKVLEIDLTRQRIALSMRND